MASSTSSEPALVACGLGYRWPGAAAPALSEVGLRLAPGECAWLGGRSGAGKSTLLRALAGVLPAAGRSRGEVRVGGGARPLLLLQNVEAQVLGTTAAEEVGFGLARRGVDAAGRARVAERVLAEVGLPGIGPREMQALSAGQRQRVLLAALLALDPAVLLLDEPTSQLDPDGRSRLTALLAELKRRGRALLVADHRYEPYAQLADRVLWMKEGRLAEGPPPAPAVAAAGRGAPVPGGAPALEVEGLAVRDASGGALLRAVSLRLAPGERVHLAGANGAGKTTLLRAVAGLLQPAAGSLRIGGRPLRPGLPPVGRVGLLFQDPERNLFERSVEEEVAFALRRLRWPRARRAARVTEVLERLGLAHLCGRSPLRLSHGERHRVALASVLAPAPGLLLLDEPFAGLGPEDRVAVLESLSHEQRRSGAALLVASHDALPLPGWAHRTVVLSGGEVARDA